MFKQKVVEILNCLSQVIFHSLKSFSFTLNDNLQSSAQRPFVQQLELTIEI